MNQKESPVTIEDVAKRAGVSRATAGRVIGNYGKTSMAVKEKVMNAVKELNYSPNAMARSLRSKKTNTIAIVVDRISNHFFVKVIEAIEKEAFDKSYSVIICNTHEDVRNEITQLKSLRSRRVDAIILAPAYTKDQKIREKNIDAYESDIPIVFIDYEPDEIKADSITSDNYGGGYKATEYLIGLGHRNIGVLTTDKFFTEKERVSGYLDALKNNNIEFQSTWLIQADAHEFGQSSHAVKELLMLNNDITAVLVVNNGLCAGTIIGIQEFGKKIPEDISLIVWDDSEITELMNITTIAQFPEFIGKVAVHRAIELVNDKSKAEEEVKKNLSIELRVRKSCKKI
ncbi:DNA-binding LacI/PurR family transcriptional regulator [Aequitasia blattaphilus]|uniref:LacI family transcriptional regulator n=1 Tax=Aequitasia blattaphilus TaxID=2949332 RepID=A0ABT1EB29_9FIRM|nr:LacI family DNA-binding transcriptional regulator [Aequitasia blattaphilus]MCP1103017.1 LacI family transcriptional regulator [Aequitasia blattaphilus]MCR8615657.1 LacI family transcriptional regulator [Aequitasia blattaphilus]